MEDFVTFEIALKLKEKGYPQKTFGDYEMQGACYIEDGRFYENGCITEVARAYTAPIISKVLKWLREEKKIFILIDVRKDLSWFYEIWGIENSLHPLGCVPYQNSQSYEQASIAGIEYVLDNLI